MWNFREERRCEECDKLYIAKASNQRRCIKCWNKVNKERTKERDRIKRERIRSLKNKTSH